MTALPCAEVLGGRAPKDAPVTVKGWIRTRRDSKGGFSFLAINDGSCFDSIQVVAPNTLPTNRRDQAPDRRLRGGSSPARSCSRPAQGPGVEMQATDVAVHRLGGRSRDLSAAEEAALASSSCAQIAHLRPRTNTFGAVARVRHTSALSIHTSSRRGLLLHPHADHHRQRLRRGRRDVPGDDARPGQPARRRPTAGRLRPGFLRHAARILTVSGQLEGEIFACALGKVYTFGPTFRAENSNTPRHLAEFWMVEPEMAFFDLTDNMDLAEAFLKHIFRDVLERVPGGHEVLQRADRQGTCIATLAAVRRSELRAACTYTEAIDDPGEVGPDSSSSRSTGAATCRPSTSGT